jgi:flagellar M-ring protein FliF
LFDPEAQAIIREGTSEVPPGATGAGSPAFNTEERESRYSRTLENTNVAPGSVQRLSVAVLVNERAALFTGPGTNPAAVARQVARIDSIVRNAVGIDSARGDRLIVTAIPFLEINDSSLVGAGNDGPSLNLLGIAERLYRPTVGLIGILATLFVAFRLLKRCRGPSWPTWPNRPRKCPRRLPG